MFIVCPKCFFKRTVDAKQIPAAATMATCPRCEEKFRFRDPESGAFIENICLEYEEQSVNSHALSLSSKEKPKENPKEKTQEEPQEENMSSLASREKQVLLAHTADSDEKNSIQSKEVDPEHEPIADDILGDALIEDKKDIKNAGEEKTQNIDDKENSPTREVEDTSDEKPLLEEEVAKPQEINEEDPLLEPSDAHGNNHKRGKKSERYQMVSDDVPWEHPERYGIFGSLLQTIARVMFRAPEFFSTIHSQSSALRPALFYALLGLFQALCLQVWFSTLEAQLVEVAPQMQESVAALSTPLAIILSPFQAIFQLVLYSAFLYLAVRITNPDRADFNLILRVVAYAYAPTILSIVPYVGPMVGLVWFVFNIVVGIRYALRLTWQKTILALSPIFVLLIFIMSNMISMFTV